MSLSVLLLTTAGLLAAADDKGAKSELKKLEGNWKMVDAELNGRVDARAEKMRMVIEDGVASTYFNTTRQEELKISVDPTADPKTIDLKPVRGGGKTGLGIYRLSEDGDKLEMCYTFGGKRPSKFTTKPGVGKGSILRIYKREGAAAGDGKKDKTDTKTTKSGGKSDAPDLKKLEGSWQMVDGEQEGRSDDRAEKKKIVIEDGKLAFYYDGREVSVDRLSLEAGADPKTIDFKGVKGSVSGKTRLGLYRLSEDGNKLEICWNQAGDKRPAKFSTKPGVGKANALWVFKRVKD